MFSISFCQETAQRSEPSLCIHQVAYEKLIKAGRGFSMKIIFVERSTLVFIVGERISSLNHQKDILPKRNIDACVIKVRDSKIIRRWSVLTGYP